jgi:hypothetical protein
MSNTITATTFKPGQRVTINVPRHPLNGMTGTVRTPSTFRPAAVRVTITGRTYVFFPNQLEPAAR